MKKEDKGIVCVQKDGNGNTLYLFKDLVSEKEIKQPWIAYAEYDVVLESLKTLSGRVLTLVEASTVDKEQRKALKDMVKGFFSEEMTRTADLMFSREHINDVTDFANDNAPEDMQTVDLEDVIKGKI